MKIIIICQFITLCLFVSCSPQPKSDISSLLLPLALLGGTEGSVGQEQSDENSSTTTSTGTNSENTDTTTVSNTTPVSGSSERTLRVSWDANRETDVNAPGGGYKVCYDKSRYFDVNSVSCETVSYDGTKTPTTASIKLPTGSWYIKVVAFSSQNSNGGKASDAYWVNVY
ncbi:MAG: hypothetical protein AAF518_07965 [Spirochaetota bacterium]